MRRRRASGSSSAPRLILSQVIKDMEKAEAPEKAWLAGMGWGVGGVNTNSDGGVYGDGYNRKLYSLSPEQNGDDAPLNGT